MFSSFLHSSVRAGGVECFGLPTYHTHISRTGTDCTIQCWESVPVIRDVMCTSSPIPPMPLPYPVALLSILHPPITLDRELTTPSAVSEPEHQGHVAWGRLCLSRSSLGHTDSPHRETLAWCPFRAYSWLLALCLPHSHPSPQLPFSIFPVEYTPQNHIPPHW